MDSLKCLIILTEIDKQLYIREDKYRRAGYIIQANAYRDARDIVITFKLKLKE